MAKKRVIPYKRKTGHRVTPVDENGVPLWKKNLRPVKPGEIRNPKGKNGFGIIPEAEAIFQAAVGNDPDKPDKNVLVKVVNNLLAIAQQRKTPAMASNAIRATELLFNRIFGMAKRNDTLTLRALTEGELTENDETAKKLLEQYSFERNNKTAV